VFDYSRARQPFAIHADLERTIEVVTKNAIMIIDPRLMWSATSELRWPRDPRGRPVRASVDHDDDLEVLQLALASEPGVEMHICSGLRSSGLTDLRIVNDFWLNEPVNGQVCQT